MSEKDKLLLRLLRKIRAHGYYHHADVALVDWFTSNAPLKEICAKYDVSPEALYKQRSRLARQEPEERRAVG
jgi:hypothetical protein